MTKHPSPIYHQSAICQILVECPKSAGQPGHSVPKMWAMRALAVEQCTSRLLTHRNSAINPPQLGHQPTANGQLGRYAQSGRDLHPFRIGATTSAASNSGKPIRHCSKQWKTEYENPFLEPKRENKHPFSSHTQIFTLPLHSWKIIIFRFICLKYQYADLKCPSRQSESWHLWLQPQRIEE